MKPFLYCLGLCIFFFVNEGTAQIIDIDYNFNPEFYPQKPTTQKEIGTVPERSTSKTPQLLTSGFVNYLNNGNIQASANLLRLNIGNPNKFYVPFYIYTGISGNGLGDADRGATSINTLLNPIGGTLNLSFNGLQQIFQRTGYTNYKFTYQLGGRISSGTDALANSDFTYYNTFANLGLFFQTQAWKEGSAENMGIFFVMAKAIGTYTEKGNFQKIFGKPTLDNHYLVGFSVDAGIEIDKVIDMKIGVYKFTNRHISPLLNNPVVSFSLNYSFNKNQPAKAKSTTK